MIQEAAPASAPVPVSPRVLLALGAEVAQPLATALRGELPCTVDICVEAEQAFANLAAADPPYDVMFVESPVAPAGSAAAAAWATLLPRLQELPSPPEILVLAGPDVAAAAALLRSGACQVLKQPLLPGELGAATLHATHHRQWRESAERFEQLETQLARNETRRERLKSLAEATREIMTDLREKSLDDRLSLLARHVAEVTKAELAGVFLVKRPQFLSLEASFGHRPGAFPKGKEFLITSGPRAGLTGHIAHMGTLFNLHGDELVQHFAVRGEEVSASPSRHCYSLLAIPLKRKSGNQETLVGLLRAENKKDAAGVAHPDLAFSKDDEEIIKIFAEAVTVALELADQKDRLKRLVDSSPSGIIAVDRQGRVTLFNNEAQRILDYLESEVLDTDVRKLYVDPAEPRKIGRLLHQRKGRVSNYETEVKSKHGTSIPIRHSSIWLFESQERTGSVGYFEDLRPIRLAEKRLESLLRAYAIIAQAKSLTDGMRGLTEMMASLLPHSFCRILLAEEGRERMQVEAVHVADGLGIDPRRLLAPMDVADWPGLERRLKMGEPYRLRWHQQEPRPTLERLSQWLGLPATIQSLLVVPLKTADKVVGMIELGEMELEKRRPFTKEEGDLASQIAAHTTALIDRMRVSDKLARQTELLRALDVASGTMRAEKEPSKLFHELVRLAVQLVSGTAGGLFLNRPHLREVELRAAYEIPDQLDWQDLGRSQAHTDGLVGRVARSGKTQTYLRYDTWPERDTLFRQLPFVTAAAVPLKSAGDVDAILFVGDASGRQQFGQDDLEILERFAAQASIALEISALMSPELRSLGHLRILHKISDYIQREQDLDKILRVVLTGVTASYGLGFNRAALLLLDDRRGSLRGSAAIGHHNQEDAQRSWEAGRQKGLEDFQAVVASLAANQLHETPLGLAIRNVSLPVRQENPDPLSRAVLGAKWLRLPATDLASLPQGFLSVFMPTTELVIVPLDARDQVRGVLVADNKFLMTPITDESIEALLAFVDTASIALENRRLLHETKARMADLEMLHRSAREIAASTQLAEVHETITRTAIALCGGSFAVLWPFDSERTEFVPGEAVVADANALQQQAIDQLRELGSPFGRVVANHGWLAEPDIVNPRFPRFTDDLRHRFTRLGTVSLQAVALRVGEDLLGVLCVAYLAARSFAERDQQVLEAFASNAALSLKNMRLLERVRQARRGAEFFAHVMASRQPTLEKIADLAREAINCDFVVIYSYDGREDSWHGPAASAGIDADAAWPPDRDDRPERSIVLEVLRRGTLHIATDLESSDLLRDSAFARRHGITSCVAVPLGVGVMFVNYRVRRLFPPESTADISLFAGQAAVAIRIVQLLDTLRRQQLQALQDFEHQIKTPVILAHAHLQGLRVSPDHDQAAELRAITALSAKAKSVSMNIRFFADLYRGEPIQARSSPIEVWRIVRLLEDGAVNNRSMIKPDRRVGFKVDHESFAAWEAAAVSLDSDLIEHAVDNVLDNAFKYSYPDQVVIIKGGRSAGGNYYISVSSRGIALPKEDVAKAVERGWQSNLAKASNAGGKGIGLWIVRHIMNAHHGALEVRPTNEAGETEVRLVFPADRLPAAGRQP